jgi:UDP-sulfoquinovose synthase
VGNRLGLNVKINSIRNPRREAEEHYYNPTYTGLKELGLRPHLLTDDVLSEMLEIVSKYKDHIKVETILPKVQWTILISFNKLILSKISCLILYNPTLLKCKFL